MSSSRGRIDRSGDRALVDTPVAVDDPGRLDRATTLARAVARDVGLPEPVLERSSMNAVYSAGPAVIRIGRATVDPVASVRLADLLRSEGISVPAPFVRDSFRHDEIDNELWATVWHAVSIDRSRPVDWRSVGAMMRRVHALESGRVASVHPLPVAADFAWWNVGPAIDAIDPQTDPLVTSEDRAAMLAAWHRLAPALDHPGTTVCHGDLHPGNVVVDAVTGRPVVLDWDLTCLSEPGWDHAALITWATRWGGSPDVYDSFVRGYGHDPRHDHRTSSLAELRLLVATVMRINAARHDPTAVDEARRRLRYWVGDPAAPQWTAV